MASTKGWLVAADGSSTAARRFHFGAVPNEQTPRHQIPTFVDESVGMSALPGLWAIVICVFCAFIASPLWLLGLPFALAGAVAGVILLARYRSRAIARAYRRTHIFTPAESLRPAAAHLAAATVASGSSSRSIRRGLTGYLTALQAYAPTGLAVDQADDALAELRKEYQVGALTADQYRACAWGPTANLQPSRDELTRLTHDCYQFAVNVWAESEAAGRAPRAVTWLTGDAPIVSPRQSGLRDLFSQ